MQLRLVRDDAEERDDALSDILPDTLSEADEQRLRAVSLRRILRHDNLTFLLVSFGAVLFAFALFMWITGRSPGGRGKPSKPVSPEEARGLVLATGTLMAGLCSLAGLRAWRVRRLFRVGEPVRASVSAISHAKGYSRVRLDYQHCGSTRSLRRSIRGSARARTLAPGDSFTILVDPRRPRRLVLAELFDG